MKINHLLIMTNKQKNLIGNSRNGDETLSFYEIIALQNN